MAISIASFNEELPITIFAIHGNLEQRPYTIESYKEREWNGGIVYYEEDFPSILFAKDGERCAFQIWLVRILQRSGRVLI